MFFDINVLVRNGKFAKIWIASTRGIKKLRSHEIASINIDSVCNDLSVMITRRSNRVEDRYSLTLSTKLVFGLIRVYQAKVKMLLSSIERVLKEIDLLKRLLEEQPRKRTVEPNVELDLNVIQDADLINVLRTRPTVDAITLRESDIPRENPIIDETDLGDLGQMLPDMLKEMFNLGEETIPAQQAEPNFEILQNITIQPAASASDLGGAVHAPEFAVPEPPAPEFAVPEPPAPVRRLETVPRRRRVGDRNDLYVHVTRNRPRIDMENPNDDFDFDDSENRILLDQMRNMELDLDEYLPRDAPLPQPEVIQPEADITEERRSAVRDSLLPEISTVEVPQPVQLEQPEQFQMQVPELPLSQELGLEEHLMDFADIDFEQAKKWNRILTIVVKMTRNENLVTIEDVAEKPLNVSSITDIFAELLVMHKQKYIRLVNKEDCNKLSHIVLGANTTFLL